MLRHLQILKLMLKDDRHLVGVNLTHAAREAHSGRVGAKGDVEVVIAGQAILGRIDEDTADNAAEGLLHEQIVANQVVGHSRIRDEKKESARRRTATRARQSGENTLHSAR